MKMPGQTRPRTLRYTRTSLAIGIFIEQNLDKIATILHREDETMGQGSDCTRWSLPQGIGWCLLVRCFTTRIIAR